MPVSLKTSRSLQFTPVSLKTSISSQLIPASESISTSDQFTPASDKVENMGAEMVKEVASKTNELAGDGTTTAVVLAQAMITEGMKKTTMGVNAMGVRFGIEACASAIVTALKSAAKPIKP